MKRRAFIGLLGASALSMPFILHQHGLSSGKRNARVAAFKNRTPLRPALPEDVSKLAALLTERSRNVYLLGGTAIATVAGASLPYLNVLIDTKRLPEVKQGLFDFGVTPVSTADLPANFVRFIHNGKAYNVLNMPFENYVQTSSEGMERGLILFAHNFLMLSVKDNYAIDPCGALQCRTADKNSFLIKPLQQPKTLVQGFEHCLAATFDRALLGLKASPEYEQIEERLFASNPGPQESSEILSMLLDYAPDILEVAGFNAASRFLKAPVCVTAAKTAAEIDLTQIEAGLRRIHKQGVEVGSGDFMRAVHTELLNKPSGKGAAQGLPEYLIAALNPFRRVDVLVDALGPKPGQPADDRRNVA